ncbi:5-dehydro-4-deoxy-D-glucuronate isomerase [Jannaschia formosa]|uniref:5-dehydro-4-deoxy-D-glucuronate isomerase n=1 Tax=Jannaschia formosa TaxID=2259592 RepID=UPI000E1C0D1A|nr:5-dehydro-4-deoxy-D-glucuronate isomerase [Jannaschia formosa]TFL17396.1 5-dehydro-4-deoxy-D-glucuronate isomerase [Jannaschia formosa]
MTTQTRYAIDPTSAEAMGTEDLRAHFHVPGLFRPGEVTLVYTHYDRMIVGGAMPEGAALTLDHVAEAGTASVLDRREMGVLAVEGSGTVSAAGQSHAMEKGDVLYLAMGSGPVTFEGEAKFYIVSTPAHRACQTRLIRPGEARRVELGSKDQANERVIIQFLHPEVHETCQLSMGYTQFSPGSMWNTMPAHLHDRRMEAYLYFDLAPQARVFHLMGRPEATRHIVVANEEAVISPPWSIHAGAGTNAYSFCWAMAGDNTDFTDMDMVPMEALR